MSLPLVGAFIPPLGNISFVQRGKFNVLRTWLSHLNKWTFVASKGFKCVQWSPLMGLKAKGLDWTSVFGSQMMIDSVKVDGTDSPE